MILLQTRARIIFNCPAKPQSKTHRTIADEPWTAEGVAPDKTLNFKPWLESPDIHRVWGWGDTQVHLLRGVARQYPCLFRHFAPCASGSISAAHVARESRRLLGPLLGSGASASGRLRATAGRRRYADCCLMIVGADIIIASDVQKLLIRVHGVTWYNDRHGIRILKHSQAPRVSEPHL